MKKLLQVESVIDADSDISPSLTPLVHLPRHQLQWIALSPTYTRLKKINLTVVALINKSINYLTDGVTAAVA